MVAGGPPLPSTNPGGPSLCIPCKSWACRTSDPLGFPFPIRRAGRVETIQIPHGSDLAMPILCKERKGWATRALKVRLPSSWEYGLRWRTQPIDTSEHQARPWQIHHV